MHFGGDLKRHLKALGDNSRGLSRLTPGRVGLTRQVPIE